MARVGEVDVRRVHVAVAQQPPRRAAAVALDDQVAGGGEDLGPGAAARHRRAGWPAAEGAAARGDRAVSARSSRTVVTTASATISAALATHQMQIAWIV